MGNQMTKDEILSMAKEAGIDDWWDSGSDWRETFNEHLERFAALVAKNERNACAKVLTENAAQCTKGSINEYILTSNAQAILVRGDK
jgi:hypothetical protein